LTPITIALWDRLREVLKPHLPKLDEIIPADKFPEAVLHPRDENPLLIQRALDAFKLGIKAKQSAMGPGSEEQKKKGGVK